MVAIETVAINIFALIVLVAAVIKVVVLILNPKAWLAFTQTIWKKPLLVSIVSVILAVVVLYYLKLSGLSYAQIFAVMLFVALISMATIAVCVKDFLSLAQKLVKERKFLKKALFPLIIWAILIILAARDLFA